MRVRLNFVFALFFVLFQANSQTYRSSPADFFFSEDVALQPRLMSPGFISTGMDEEAGALAPENDEFYFVVKHQSDLSIIMVTRFDDGFWMFPEVASFSGNHLDASPFITPDGEYLYFVSERPVDVDDQIRNWNIWRCSREDGRGWSEPELMPFSTDKNELSVSVDNMGTVYFCADYESETVSLDRSAFDIYQISQQNDGSWSEAKKLDKTINSTSISRHPAISPDGSILVFSSDRMGNHGNEDLFISFRDTTEWTVPVNLDRVVNSSARDINPVFSPDGNFLLFTSLRKRAMPENLNYSELKKWLLGPGNGRGDIWYLDANSLKQYRGKSSD